MSRKKYEAMPFGVPAESDDWEAEYKFHKENNPHFDSIKSVLKERADAQKADRIAAEEAEAEAKKKAAEDAAKTKPKTEAGTPASNNVGEGTK